MGFPRGPLRAPAPVRVRGSVFAVGRRVYVACAGDRSARVTLTDDTGKRALGSLGDGTEVTILAWRPGSAGTTQYSVRATESGLEGWLPVGNLRGTEAAISPAPGAPPPPTGRPAPLRVGEFGESGRRFGQHFSVSPRPTVSTLPDSPSRTREGGDSKRRFGQRSE
jgi:hypothetical protein